MGKGKEFVRGYHVAAKIFESLVNAIVDAGGTGEDIRRIETNGVLRKQIAELVVRGKQSADGVIRLFVDYTRPLADLIKDCGFDWKHSDINEKNFPVTKRPNGQVETKMYHFNRTISSDQAIQEMMKEGYRPAETPELLAYAKVNPDEQRKYPIVGLGSVWRHWSGHRDVPCLDRDGLARHLFLHWLGTGWDGPYRFLAVRKS